MMRLRRRSVGSFHPSAAQLADVDVSRSGCADQTAGGLAEAAKMLVKAKHRGGQGRRRAAGGREAKSLVGLSDARGRRAS